MCGIAGIYFKRAVKEAELDQIAGFFQASLEHRGPDAFGLCRSERGVFANLRLAIVDRASGNQPIYTPDGRLGIVYNGEVYNWEALRRPLETMGYRFTTHTDTEAVLAAFAQRGEAAFAELNGMFALCIWEQSAGAQNKDSFVDAFVLARDRFGMKPLYFYEDPERFAFASEIKTLLGLPGLDLSLNPLGFQDYLSFRYTLVPHTLFKRIEKLPAGCALRFDRHGRKVRRFAEIELHEPAQLRRPQDYLDELDQLLGDAVRSQLMGEVPIGVLLSGGLDSSALACYLQRAGARLKAYNIGFAEVNEFPFSRDVARHFDLDYVEICMTEAELMAGMDATLMRLDEPIADPACFALSRLCEEIRQDVTVVLSGEGGDEMFAGYGQHLFALDPSLDKERCFAEFYAHSANFDDAQRWLRDKQLPPQHLRYKAMAYDRADTVLNGMLGFELQTWLPENLMMKADKVLMSHSLEGRFPFLDLPLYQFAARLPQAMKLPSPSSTKHVLRSLMADRLPRSVIERRKMGFTVPFVFFLLRQRERFEAALDLLRGEAVAEVLDLDAIAALLRAFYAGQQDIPVFKVWNLFVLVFWFAHVLPLYRSGQPLKFLLQQNNRPNMSRAKASKDQPVAPRAALLEPTQRRPRLAIYTVLLGDKEPLNNPLGALSESKSKAIDLDFICFTDNRALDSPVWRFRYLDDAHLPPERLSRRPKALPHEYLADYDFSLYIDNTVVLQRLPDLYDLLTERPYLFRVFRHATRKNPVEEADAVASIGYDSVDRVCDQLDFYAQSGPPAEITPLSTCTVILRSHAHPAVLRLGVVWWEEILAFSKRDQLSFDYALRQTGCAVQHFEGTLDKNDLVLWPILPGGRRVLASFDPQRYAWLHRNDAEAQRNPRAHFLAHGEGDGSAVSRNVPLFEYICHKQASSLGARISPRRAVAGGLGDFLARYRNRSGNLLLVHLRDALAGLTFLDSEFGPASAAIAMMLPNYSGQVFQLSWADMCNPGVQFGNLTARFDAIFLFGLAPDCVHLVAAKFGRLLNPVAGIMAIIAAGECDLAAIRTLQEQLDAQFGSPVRLSVTYSCHDDLRDAIPNSLLCLEWPDQRPPRAVALLPHDVLDDIPPGRNVVMCDGGLSNRLNALIFALILRHRYGQRWVLNWPRNSWCGAAFGKLFEIDLPVYEHPINHFKRHEQQYLLVMHENQCDFDARRVIINKGLTGYADYQALLNGNTDVFYFNSLIPSFVSFEDMRLGLSGLRIEPGLRRRAETFCKQHQIDATVLGLHIRKTDFGTSVNDDELFNIAASSPLRFFVCSDDRGVNERFSRLPNCCVFEKSFFPNKADVTKDWLQWGKDAEGRVFPFNIDRSEESVLEGLIDLLILSRTTLVKTSGSTFLAMAGVFKATGFFGESAV